MTTALVIGNGESRLELDLNDFATDYTLIGCNAIHRDTVVEHLICFDRRMIEEAVVSENTEHTKIYVRDDWHRYYRKVKKDKRIYQLPELPFSGNLKYEQPVHWGSGPYAVLLAASSEFNNIMLIGFDLYPIDNKVNNVYKGTKNYSNKDSRPVDPLFWKLQIGKIFQHFSEKSFIVWNKKDWIMPKEWQYPNVRFEEIN